MIKDVDGFQEAIRKRVDAAYDSGKYGDMISLGDVFQLIDKYTEEPIKRNERAINSYYGGYNLMDLQEVIELLKGKNSIINTA